MTQEELERKRELEREERLAKMRELVEKSSKQTALDLSMSVPDEDAPIETIDFSSTANPDESHKIYYQIQSILKSNLPIGTDNVTKSLRAIIREEKNIFLNRGKFKDANGVRHSDGRMTFIEPFLSEALKICLVWVSTGAQPYDLYEKFLDKNKELGYYD